MRFPFGFSGLNLSLFSYLNCWTKLTANKQELPAAAQVLVLFLTTALMDSTWAYPL